MIDKLLSERNIPKLSIFKSGAAVKNASDFEKRRAELKAVLCENEYGILPPAPERLSVTINKTDKNHFCGGSAELRYLTFTVTIDGDDFSFPVYACIPVSAKPVPAFVFINFHPEVYNEYLPVEEITDRGFAIFGFCHKDVTEDNGDFESGIAKYLVKNRDMKNSSGKIALWA